MSQRKPQPRRGQKPADAPETENDRIAGRNPVLEALRSDAKIDLIYVGRGERRSPGDHPARQGKGCIAIALCNVVGSSIARATDSGAYIHVGPEIGVASTKAFTGQVTVLTMLALMIARVKVRSTRSARARSPSICSICPPCWKRCSA